MHCLSAVKKDSLLCRKTCAECPLCPALRYAFSMSLCARGSTPSSTHGLYSSKSIELITSITCYLLKLHSVTLYPPPTSSGLDSSTMKRAPDLSKLIWM